ncbi:MAG: dTMP kinase [Clostridia bacterium]|nr:dTMP kinase [Clostridia bacterium]
MQTTQEDRMKGKFVSLEGCEGSGKSTQTRLLSAYLEEQGTDFLFTREPGGSTISEDIRRIILNGQYAEKMSPECEALLYAASRIQHLKQVIIPALEAGKLVLCDRYVDSSFAYQGHARGLGMDYIEKINATAMEYQPDLTLFMDINPVQAFERKHGADKGDRIEQEGIEFHQKVYEGYKILEDRFPARFVAVDCSGTKYETQDKIRAILKERGII